MEESLKERKDKILEPIMIDKVQVLKFQVRSLKRQITILKNKRNIRNCEYKFVCDGNQKKGSVICDDCFEHIRKKALKQKTN